MWGCATLFALRINEVHVGLRHLFRHDTGMAIHRLAILRLAHDARIHQCLPRLTSINGLSQVGTPHIRILERVQRIFVALQVRTEQLVLHEGDVVWLLYHIRVLCCYRHRLWELLRQHFLLHLRRDWVEAALIDYALKVTLRLARLKVATAHLLWL